MFTFKTSSALFIFVILSGATDLHCGTRRGKPLTPSAPLRSTAVPNRAAFTCPSPPCVAPKPPLDITTGLQPIFPSIKTSPEQIFGLSKIAEYSSNEEWFIGEGAQKKVFRLAQPSPLATQEFCVSIIPSPAFVKIQPAIQNCIRDFIIVGDGLLILALGGEKNHGDSLSFYDGAGNPRPIHARRQKKLLSATVPQHTVEILFKKKPVRIQSLSLKEHQLSVIGTVEANRGVNRISKSRRVEKHRSTMPAATSLMLIEQRYHLDLATLDRRFGTAGTRIIALNSAQQTAEDARQGNDGTTQRKSAVLAKHILGSEAMERRLTLSTTEEGRVSATIAPSGEAIIFHDGSQTAFLRDIEAKSIKEARWVNTTSNRVELWILFEQNSQRHLRRYAVQLPPAPFVQFLLDHTESFALRLTHVGMQNGIMPSTVLSTQEKIPSRIVKQPMNTGFTHPLLTTTEALAIVGVLRENKVFDEKPYEGRRYYTYRLHIATNQGDWVTHLSPCKTYELMTALYDKIASISPSMPQVSNISPPLSPLLSTIGTIRGQAFRYRSSLKLGCAGGEMSSP